MSLPLLSIVIPAYNEEKSIAETLNAFSVELRKENIPHEFVVVNDNSKDSTEKVILDLKNNIPEIRLVNNTPPNGFGFAVRKGLDSFSGDCVAIVMADMSDRPCDLVAYYRTYVEKKVDAVFGSRFIEGGKTIDYPRHKMILNRILNNLIRILFLIKYNDITNAFKLYDKKTIEGIKPFLSEHYNLTVEIPLKTIINGYSYVVVPNWWINRKQGVSKLKLKEMGGKYLSIILYYWLKNINKK